MLRELVPVSEQAVLNSRLFLNCFVDMTDEQARIRFSDDVNNALFIGLHLLDARMYLARKLGLHPDHPFEEALKHVRSISEVTQWPPLGKMCSVWIAVSSDVESRLQELTSDELAAPTRHRFPVKDNTLLGMLAFLLQHESYHIGQLAFLRKAAGLPEMRYGKP